jgi:formamidopyrimidine-DNA glycosylase
MPELPDITVYVERLEALLKGEVLERVRLRSPFVLRSVEPGIDELAGLRVESVRRIGKRIVLGFDGELFLVIHLMIAGRLRWREPGAKVPGRIGHAAFDFAPGTLLLTEAGTTKRAAIHVVRGAAALASHDPGGLELFEADVHAFAAVLRRENHTLKRSLTDPRLFSGIGNAYSDEILHRARMSPLKLSRAMDDGEVARLFEAARQVLDEWTNRLRDEVGDGFPEKVTAFRPGMAVHGRYDKPCPDCGTPVQRIIYAENETNYCARCQTGGRLLADRSMSRLLKKDWPRSVDELE